MQKYIYIFLQKFYYMRVSATNNTLNRMAIVQEGSIISRQSLNENLETPYLAPTLFYHLPGLYLITGFLNPPSLSLAIVA